MRFVFIATMATSPWGGSEELWSQAAKRLADEGHQVTASVAFWPTLSPKVTALRDHGIDLQPRVPDQLPRLPLRLWRRVSRTRDLTQEEKVLAWLQRQKPDLVVISQGGTMDGLGWMKLCRNAGVPFVAIVQCNQEGWWPPDCMSSDLRAAYQAAGKIYCVSRRNLQLLEYQLAISLPRAEVVWNPFNVPVDESPAWPPENGVWKLACVARLDPAAKGQDTLLQVLSQPTWRERPVELNFYGKGGWEQSIQRLAAYFHLRNVHFRGHVGDVRKIWEENHLLVLPSRYEGLPLALIEAMWCARPAVVTDVGGNAEMCVDGETGFIAAAPTAPLFAEALERGWDRRAQGPAMGQAARARVEKLVPKDPVGVFCRQLIQAAKDKS